MPRVGAPSTLDGKSSSSRPPVWPADRTHNGVWKSRMAAGWERDFRLANSVAGWCEPWQCDLAGGLVGPVTGNGGTGQGRSAGAGRVRPPPEV